MSNFLYSSATISEVGSKTIILENFQSKLAMTKSSSAFFCLDLWFLRPSLETKIIKRFCSTYLLSSLSSTANGKENEYYFNLMPGFIKGRLSIQEKFRQISHFGNFRKLAIFQMVELWIFMQSRGTFKENLYQLNQLLYST